MPTNSLVPCPKCNTRRHFAGMRKGSQGAEIRLFDCTPCGVITEYELRGRSVQKLIDRPNQPSEAVA